MSNPDNGSARKTLAIKLEPGEHAQLTLVAQIRDSTLDNEFHKAVTAHIQAAKAEPDFAQRADSIIRQIEREAAERQAAIASLFDSSSDVPISGADDESDSHAQPARPNRRSKTGGGTPSDD